MVTKALNINALRQDIENFSRVEAGATERITCIPTRGVLAELSGDLADACWVRTSNIMRNNPKMVAAIFVENIDEPLRTHAIGSCLLIETSVGGVPTIIVRGINPRQEIFDAGGSPLSFFQGFVDNYVVDVARELARESGNTEAFIIAPKPGTGALSNRPGLKVRETYNKLSTGQEVRTDERTDFNNYDISDKCELLRVVSV
jgi:hypothetical protein